MWLDLVWRLKKYFGGSAAGSPEILAKDSTDQGHRWRRGQRSVKKCFAKE